MAALQNLGFIGKQEEGTLRKSVEQNIVAPPYYSSEQRRENHRRRSSLLPSIKDSTRS
jgi:hypothetical protein